MTPISMRIQRTLLFVSAGAVAAATASAQIISDNFETNTSASYTVVDDGTPDGTQIFAFDYVAAGIPLAPNSVAGDTSALRLTANDGAGAADAWTIFHNTPVNVPIYMLSVDVYNAFTPGSFTATEYAQFGVGGDGVTSHTIWSPPAGSGVFAGFTGDGDSTLDYLWHRDAANTPASLVVGTVDPLDPSYLNHGANNLDPFFQALYPTGSVAGSPGNVWAQVDILVDNTAGTVSIFFEDTLTFFGDTNGTTNGQVNFGLYDRFASLSGPTSFTLFDNFVVTEIFGFPVGTSYCTAAANSTGVTGSISALGSDVAANNAVLLVGSDLPNNQFGYFLNSMTQGFVPMPGVSQGNICLGGGLGRYNGPGQVLNSGTSGGVELTLDLTATPTPMGPTAVTAGQTWNFQLWYRDLNPMPTSNFTDGVSISFQ